MPPNLSMMVCAMFMPSNVRAFRTVCNGFFVQTDFAKKSYGAPMAGQSKTATLLKKLRERTGLSVREAAAAARLKPSSYSYYEDDFKKPYLPASLIHALLPAFEARGVGASELLALAGLSDEPHLGNSPDLPEPKADRDSILIPEYNVREAMGDGFTVDRETIKDHWTFSRRYLSEELRLNLRNLVVIEVIGDSMEPTLKTGDRVLVDMGDRRVGIPGIFVLWDGDGTIAKRLELIPNSKPPRLLRISDNPLHGKYEVLAEETNIIGRIVWFARRL